MGWARWGSANVYTNKSIAPPCTSAYTGNPEYLSSTIGKAHAYVKLAQGHTQVTRPVIFVEGLDFGTVDLEDPAMDTSNPNIESSVVRHGDLGWDIIMRGAAEGLLAPEETDGELWRNFPATVNNLNQANYDVIFLDFDEGADYIQKNAELFMETIRLVNERKVADVNGNKHGNIVVGASMGGQIVRYGLATMEKNNEAHCTHTFVSFDSPHKGATIPLSIQAMAWYSYEGGSDVNGLWRKLNMPAARQLLVNNLGSVVSDGSVSIDAFLSDGDEDGANCPLTINDNYSCLRDLYVAEMATLGYPEKTRNIAIACGSETGNGQGYPRNSNLFDGRRDASPVGINIGYVARIDLIALTGAYNDVCTKYKCDDEAIKQYCTGGNNLIFSASTPDPNEVDGSFWSRWYYPPVFQVSEYLLSKLPCRYFVAKVKTNEDFPPYDNAPGGTRRDLYAVRAGLQSVAENMNGVEYEAGIVPLENQNFISTMSALDIQGWTDENDLFNNIFNADIIDNNITPFDDYYAPSGYNLRHAEIDNAMLAWVTEEVNNWTDFSAQALPNADGSRYNYNENFTLLRDWTVNDGGELAINGGGNTEYGNGAPTGNYSTVRTSTNGGCINSDITVNDGGILVLGSHNQGRKGKAAILEGSTVHIHSGGHLKLYSGSELLIKEGATLIIDDGATIDLLGSESTIIIEGELIINGSFDFDGTGYWQFSDGHLLTVNANEFYLKGAGKGQRTIRLNENTNLTLPPGVNLRLENGLMEYVNDNRVEIKNAAIDVRFFDFEYTGALSSEANALIVNNPTDFFVQFCDFNNFDTGIQLGDIEPDKDITLHYCQFNDFNLTGLSVLGSKSKISLFNTTFNASSSATFESAVSLQEVQEVRATGCTINGNGYNEANLSTFNNGYRLKNVEELVLFGGSINNCKRGINGLPEINPNTGIEVVYENDVILMGGARVEDCEVGIELQGGVLPPDVLGEIHGFGLVMIDCGKLINNNTGIKGQDVLLDIDALSHCGCEAGDNQHRPNVFINPYGNYNYFDICYVERDVQTIFAKGNYWSEVPVSNVNYNIDDVCDGNGVNKDFQFNPVVLVEPVGCSPFLDPGDNPQTPGICELIYSDDNGIEIITTTAQQARKGAYQVYDNNTKKARDTYKPLAVVHESIRDVASDECKLDIDVARTFNKGSIPLLYGLQVEESSILEEDLDVKSKQLEELEKLQIFPNPAENRCTIKLPEGNYELIVFDALGKQLWTSNNAMEVNLDLSAWQTGIYFVRAKEIVTGKVYSNRLIKQ